MKRKVGVVLVALLTVAAAAAALSLTGGAGTTAVGFTEVADEYGVNYTATGTSSPTGADGVFVTDYNGDERPDVLLTGGSPRPERSGAATTASPQLYRNTGDGYVEAGVLPHDRLDDTRVESALFFDYDNDADQDLLLLARGDEPVFLENTGGDYQTADVGLNVTLSVPIGAATADYNGDGCLDLFIYQNGNWRDRSPMGMERAFAEGDQSVTDDNGGRNLLFRGTCGTFENATASSGVAGTRWSLGASFTDLTGDGRPDIHVTNDYNNDYVYVNEGDGQFRQVQMGEATDRNGMSSEVADVNGDGRPDIFVTNIYFNKSGLSESVRNYVENRLGKRVKGNNIMINRGNATFVDRASEYDVRKGGWGWAASIADFDNDGSRDLFHATQAFEGVYDGTTATSFAVYPVFRERTGPESFTLRDPRELGFQPADERGAARLDMDRDGHLDLVTAVYSDDDYKLYENNVTAGNWFEVRVESLPDQTAVGAEVTVTTADGETTTRTKNANTDFISQESRVLHFGLDDAEGVETLQVVYPDGTERTYENLDANQRVVVGPDGIETLGEGGGLLSGLLSLASVTGVVA
jgi:hypothetical protein